MTPLVKITEATFGTCALVMLAMLLHLFFLNQEVRQLRADLDYIKVRMLLIQPQSRPN